MSIFRLAATAAAAAAAAALLPLAAAAPAAAAAAPPDDGAHLILVTQSVTDPSEADFASLSCDPIGGTHPKAESACMDLEEVDGKFEDLSRVPGMCPMVYEPVTLHAYGHWRGELVHYSSEVHPNRCMANRETGGDVFDY